MSNRVNYRRAGRDERQPNTGMMSTNSTKSKRKAKRVAAKAERRGVPQLVRKKIWFVW